MKLTKMTVLPSGGSQFSWLLGKPTAWKFSYLAASPTTRVWKLESKLDSFWLMFHPTVKILQSFRTYKSRCSQCACQNVIQLALKWIYKFFIANRNQYKSELGFYHLVTDRALGLIQGPGHWQCSCPNPGLASLKSGPWHPAFNLVKVEQNILGSTNKYFLQLSLFC